MQIIAEYRDLENIFTSYNKNEDDKLLLRKSFEVARDKHDGQYRLSGEAYISHPLNVAAILARLQMDTHTVCAGLLHDTLEDCDIEEEELLALFNTDILFLVDGMTEMNMSKTDEGNAENLRKTLSKMSEDVRVVILKLADRLHNMSTLEFQKPIKRILKAEETLEIFVPVAKMLGMNEMKCELEDLCFKWLREDLNNYIEKQRIALLEANSGYIETMMRDLENAFDDDVTIKFELLNNYGISKKLIEGVKLSEFYDFYIIKVIVKEKLDCYYKLGIVHEKYKHVARKIKDYIAIPKYNKYKALHTTVFGPNKMLIQIQIMTEKMYNINEYGVTYKFSENDSDYVKKYIKNRFEFISDVEEIDAITKNNLEFVELVKNDVFTSYIYVYTPKGDLIKMPIGSTIIDFAYKLNSLLGEKVAYAHVNNKSVSIDYELNNMDIVEIITNSDVQPNDNWLEYAKTANAKNHISRFLDEIK